MARYRDRTRNDDEPVRGALDERRRLLAAASLTGAVVVVLVLGFALRADGPRVAEAPRDLVGPLSAGETRTLPPPASPVESAPPEAPVDERALAEREPPAPAARPEPRPAKAMPAASLDDRAASDAVRLRGTDAAWTVQLVVVCDPTNARRILDLVDGSAKLYVLPVNLDGRGCYRVCWGSYPARASADAHRDLPAALASEMPDRQVRAVADLAP